MSDRRPSKLHDPKAATLWWNTEGKDLSIVELYEAVTDPVAVVRRGVESGTIKGEVVDTDPYGVMARHFDRGTYIVIGPVSDGGETWDDPTNEYEEDPTIPVTWWDTWREAGR